MYHPVQANREGLPNLLLKSQQSCFYHMTKHERREYFGNAHKGKRKSILERFYHVTKPAVMDWKHCWVLSEVQSLHTEPPQLPEEPATARPRSRGGGSNEDDYRVWNGDFAPSFLPDYRNRVLKQTECGEALLKAVDTVQMRSQIRRDVPVNEHRAVEQCKTVNSKYSSQHFSSFSSRNSTAESFIC